MLRKVKLLYHINCMIKETGEPFSDGSHIVYMNYTILVERARYYIIEITFGEDLIYIGAYIEELNK